MPTSASQHWRCWCRGEDSNMVSERLASAHRTEDVRSAVSATASSRSAMIGFNMNSSDSRNGAVRKLKLRATRSDLFVVGDKKICPLQPYFANCDPSATASSRLAVIGFNMNFVFWPFPKRSCQKRSLLPDVAERTSVAFYSCVGRHITVTPRRADQSTVATPSSNRVIQSARFTRSSTR